VTDLADLKLKIYGRGLGTGINANLLIEIGKVKRLDLQVIISRG
jgi:hypothetical protein